MKINVTQKRFNKFLKRKFLNKQNRNKDCYTCEKLEHFSRKCTLNKYKNKLFSYNNNDKFMTTTTIDVKKKYKCLF